MKKIALLSIIILNVISMQAQTNVSGGIYQNATWSLAGSPYIVNGSIVVFPGVTLNIQPGVEIRIIDNATGNQVAVGEVGEIWCKSPQVMKGYWNNPKATAESITPDGWFKTGDAGYKDADGYIYIHDRVKDMIVSGGENVYPAEVESALMGHPGIADIAVIGVPHEKWGETVKAIVVRKPDVEVTEGEIIEFSKGLLARFKCPTSVDWIDALPRNPSGKILKKDLRAPYWEGRERMVN